MLGDTPDLAQRVRGQTSDLSARVLAEAEAPAGSWRAQAERARVLAERASALLVVWVVEMFSPPESAKALPERTFVAVYLSRSKRLYAHPVGPPLSSASLEQRSAALELAALTARAALRSLDEPEALGIPLADIDAAPREPEAPPAARPLPAPPPKPAPESVPLDGLVALGAVLDGDGVTSLRVPALRVGLGLRRNAFRALLSGEWTAMRERATTDAVLELERLTVGFEAQFAWFDSPRTLTPYTALSLGATAFHRATRVTGPTVSATAPNTSWSPGLGLLVGLEWDSALGSLDQRLVVRGGARYLPAAPVLELSREIGEDLRYPVALLQPFAGLDWVAFW